MNPSRRAAGSNTVNTVVFDLGGVLIDWNPRYLYRRLIDDPQQMERFLSEVCTPEWNLQQDAGRSFAEATRVLCASHPEQADLITAFSQRWEEMLGGTIPGMVELFGAVKRAGHATYALTNWSAETFHFAESRYGFLREFDGLVVSGRLGTAKPHRAIYDHLISEYAVDPQRSVFIDDNLPNVQTAQRLGFAAVRFESAAHTHRALASLGVLAAP